MDSERFDTYVKALFAGRTSRRVLTSGVLAGAVAGLPLFDLDREVLARRRKKRRKRKKQLLRCSGDSCDGTGGKPCGGRHNCQCYRAAQGGNVCASSLQSSCSETCSTNSDCPRGHVCVEGGPACCGTGVRFCKKACFK